MSVPGRGAASAKGLRQYHVQHLQGVARRLGVRGRGLRRDEGGSRQTCEDAAAGIQVEDQTGAVLEVVRRPPVRVSGRGGASGFTDGLDVGVRERGASRTLRSQG